MLKSLLVKNYALIDELEMDFSGGLSIITGETGAGKSILLGAMGLILGQRADSGALKDHTRKCVVEGVFDVKAYQLQDWFRQHDLDYEEQSLIRRELSASGRSRAFINDTPVTLEVLNQLSARLIDIHSQHQSLLLNKHDFQIAVIDTLSGTAQVLEAYRQNYKTWKRLQYEFTSLQQEGKRSKEELDYIQFLYEELNEAALKEGEQEELEAELDTLNHAEEIKQRLSRSDYLLEAEEAGLLSKLNELRLTLQTLASLNTKLQELDQRVESVSLELQDIAADVKQLEADTVYDPERIEQLNQRLNLIYSLQQKHQLQRLEELIAKREELREKLDGISNSDERLQELEKALEELGSTLHSQAEELTKLRQAAIPKAEEEVQSLLQKLGMPGARLRIVLEKTSDFTANGNDQIQFLFATNKGSAFKPVAKVASGGELSRLMLVIKSIISRSQQLATIIFDEIDTGVSGEIANRVGGMLQEMGIHMQVIVISHLPQIAGKGQRHYKVYKQEAADRTQTKVRELIGEERIEEVARMLSGETLTDAALANARDLLG